MSANIEIVPQKEVKKWGKPEILKTLKNPDERLRVVHTINHVGPEVTFFGDTEQPDYGTISIIYVASSTMIELRSLKKYLQSFCDERVSYERFVSVVYKALQDKYRPKWLVVSCAFNPRGGLSSTVKIDSQDQ